MTTRNYSLNVTNTDVPSQIEDVPYHAKSVETCFELLRTRYTGLTEEEAQDRLKQQDGEDTQENYDKSTRKLFLGQLKNLVSILLFGAALVSFILSEPITGMAILAALLINSGFNILTQWMGQKSVMGIEALQAGNCTVRRGSRNVQVAAAALVPGDILILASGDLIPVDARLVQTEELQVDESLVTGESVLIRKDAHAIHIPDEDLTEQMNMVFAGCRVKTGRGEAVVTATSNNSVMGKIAKLTKGTKKRDTSLTKGLNRMGINIFAAVTLLSLCIVGIQCFAAIKSNQPLPIMEMLQFFIILIVAAIPETLPSIATFALSIGIQHLSKENVLVKNLQAMESIGNISVVCTDKTGTLTQNSLTLQKLFLPEVGEIDYNPAWKDGKSIPCRSIEETLRISRMNNTTVMDGLRSAFIGDPIDIALYRSSSSLFERGYFAAKVIPFDATTLKTATVTKTNEGRMISMIKGAPEAVLKACNSYMRPDGEIVELTQAERYEFLLKNQDLAIENALRVIGFAEKEITDLSEDPYENATFIAWVCLVDPPKAGVLESIQYCQDVGLRVVMITGDQKATAAVTARELGIMLPNSEVWTRNDLDTGVEIIPKTVAVFARTKPEEKLAIVQSLQQSGETVAMVGDGVNDTPALQKSDIAIAMGLHGTDAAKECSDIILLNDRFDGLVNAIMTSRSLTHNIKLCVKYVLSCNFTIVLLLFTISLLSLIGFEKSFQLPINAVQILWLNIILVTLPTLTLALKPANVMYLKSKQAVNQLNPLTKEDLSLVLFWSFLMMGAGAAAFLISHFLLDNSPAVTSTLTFTTVAFTQTFHLLNIHLLYSNKKLSGIFNEISNEPLIGMVITAAILLQIGAVSIEFLQPVFGTDFIPLIQWLIPFGISIGAVGLSMGMSKGQSGK